MFEARFKNVPSDLVEAKPTPIKSSGVISGANKPTTPLPLPTPPAPPPKAQAQAVTHTPVIPPQV